MIVLIKFIVLGAAAILYGIVELTSKHPSDMAWPAIGTGVVALFIAWLIAGSR